MNMDRHAILIMAFLYHSELCLAIKTTLYIKTNVVQDKCSRPRMGLKIRMRSVFSCSLRCTSNANCWRYMVCPDNTNGQLVTCEMFDEGQNCVVPEGTGDGCRCYMKKSSCVGGACSCAMGYYGNYCDSIIKDCIQGGDIFYPAVSHAYSLIQPHPDVEPFEVFCDFNSKLTTFHNRDISCSKITFNRTYSEYVDGFGNPYTDFWLGLKRIKLLVDIAVNPKIDILFFTTAGVKQVVYTNVVIEGPSSNYKLSATKGWGDLSDNSFLDTDTNNLIFSTFDRDNTTDHCPVTCGGGWWYADSTDCCNVNLNAPHEDLRWDEDISTGITTRLFMRVGKV